MIDWFIDQMKTNQFMSGAIGGSVSFAILNYLKSWILFVFFLIKNFFIREITLLSASNREFYDSFNKYVSKFIKHPKNIKISSKTTYIRTSSDGFTTTQRGKAGGVPPVGVKTKHEAGYGAHWFWYNWFTFVRVVISLDSDNHTESKTETISVYFSGLRPRSMRNKFYEEFCRWHTKETVDPGYFKFNEWGNAYKIKGMKERPLESIFMDEKDLARVDNAVAQSFEADERFDKLGRNKTIGILLEGPPGTGKSSLIQALASKYKKDIYYVDFSPKEGSFSSILSAVSGLPKNTFIVMEDIDCYECTHKRDEDASKSSQLATILRMIDGIDLPDNSIVFATTNNVDILDEALTRPGRFDVRIHMGFADKCMAQKMIEYIDPSKINLLDEMTFPVSQAELQAKILGR
jgi:predicted AAA+ superfamily ATPase